MWTSLRDMPPALRRYLVVVALFMLGNSSNMFLLLRARELGLPQTQVPLPASVVFGALYQSAGPGAAFAFSGSCAVLAAGLLVGWVRPAMPAR